MKIEFKYVPGQKWYRNSNAIPEMFWPHCFRFVDLFHVQLRAGAVLEQAHFFILHFYTE